TVNANHTSGTNTIAVSGSALANVLAGWTGTLTISALGLSNVCAESWVVSLELLTGEFSGTWQSSSGTLVACGQGGTLQGRVTSPNTLEGVTFNAVVGASNCTIVAGNDVMSGPFVGGTFTAQAFDTVRCPGLADANRTLTISMRK